MATTQLTAANEAALWDASWTPAAPARQATQPVRRPQPRWDERLAHQEVREVLERLATVFPADYDFAAEGDLWDRLEAAVERAFRKQDWRALRVALDGFEDRVRESFRNPRTIAPAADLPPADTQLELWFEDLPE